MTSLCRRHHTPLVTSIAGVGFCPTCRRIDRAEIVALFREGAQRASTLHSGLIAKADSDAAARRLAS